MLSVPVCVHGRSKPGKRMNTQMLKRYLLWFANEHLDFRYAELQSILKLLNINIKYVEKSETQPYCVVDLPSESDVHRIASRSVSLRFCIQLWARATSKAELDKSLQAYSEETIKRVVPPTTSFKINVETFCNRQTQAEKVEKIESFSYLPLEGPIRLKDPEITLQFIEYYGMDSNHVPASPCDLFFGRWIAAGQRELITKLSLKTRKFIGNTTMDPQLSLLMANQAQVRPGDLVLDPFVGTGSLLVAAAHFGAHVLGTDIDFMTLHAKTRPSRIQDQKHRAEDESVRANVAQYGHGARYVDVLVADCSRPLWRPALQLDAIITDPPYGIREATERLGGDGAKTSHLPRKVGYGMAELYRDLLAFAASHLRLHGRLVCWLPVVREDYCLTALPAHPCLRLLANSEQVLNSFTARRLLTFEKTQEPTVGVQATCPEIAMEDFRPKFFRVGEEIRNERKQRKAAAVAAYQQAKVVGQTESGKPRQS